MTGTAPPAAIDDLFAAFLSGAPVEWSAFGMTAGEFLRACRDRDVTGLVDEHLRRGAAHPRWPDDVRDAVAAGTRARMANELLRCRETIAVLRDLALEGVHALILKGTALAYTVYDTPAARPRFDTDLLVRRDHVARVRRVMNARGYTEPVHADRDLLFCQFPLRKTDPHGLVHAFDIHWSISTQPVFRDVLTFDEIAARAVAVPALGPHARTAAPVHALLLACIHPVMHHRNVDWLLWRYDVHVIARSIGAAAFDVFVDLAIAKRVGAICAFQLDAVRAAFDTPIADGVVEKLRASAGGEPSAAYLCGNRTWADELRSSMRHLPRWRDRLRLFREVTLPPSRYMLAAYGFTPSSVTAALLPALYVHRLSSGGWRVLRRSK